MDPAASVAAEDALAVFAVPPVVFERRLLTALDAAEEATVLVRDDRSTFARDVSELSTLDELFLFTRLLEPEIRPERKFVVLTFSVPFFKPCMLPASVSRLLMLLEF